MNYLLVTRYLIQHKEMLVRCKNNSLAVWEKHWLILLHYTPKFMILLFQHCTAF